MGSKSSSKSLTGSVDSAVKSVVKSVESVLPKNMNMKHVLLAVLVGLLLCMLMGQNVEGFSMLTGGEDSWTVSDAGAADGYCSHKDGLGGSMRRGCVVDSLKNSSGVDDGDNTNLGLATAICSSGGAAGVSGTCVGDSGAPSDGSGQLIVNKLADTANSAIADHTLSCKWGETVDDCPDFGTSDTACGSDAGKAAGCVWSACGFNNDDTVKMGADNSNPEDASVTVDFQNALITEYERWNKCMFDGKGTYGGHTGAPDDLTGGEIPTFKAGSDVGGDGSVRAGSDVTGLTGWINHQAGVPRNVLEKDNALSEADMQARNAIPMTQAGEVPAALIPFIPPSWKQGFENMFKYCQHGDENETAMIGWDKDFRSLQCLNYNDSLKTTSITSRKPSYECRCGSGCASGTTQSSHTELQNIIDAPDSECGLTDKLTDGLASVTVDVGKRSVEGAKELATNALKTFIA
jgi:hypothetical protein